VDHTSQCEQAAKGSRCAKRHICPDCLDDVCQEHNRHKHHLYKKEEEDQSPCVDYIVATMSDNLD
jgi:hypothetical protein